MGIESEKINEKNIHLLFSGVGGIELGFTQTNKFIVNYANEFDKNAQLTYKENFEDIF